MKFQFKYQLFILFFLSFAYFCNAQSRIYATYIYNFTKYITWHQSYQEGDFIVAVLGDGSFSNDLRTLLQSKKIRNQEFLIKQYNTVDDIEKKCHILFIPSLPKDEYESTVDKVLKKIKGSSTLLITDEFHGDKYKSMINFALVNDKQRFELNPARIKKQGLEVSSTLLTLAIIVGDSPEIPFTPEEKKEAEKDWEQLYKVMEDALKGEQKTVLLQKEELGKVKEKIDVLGKENDEKQKKINEKNEILSKKEQAIQEQLNVLGQFKNEISQKGGQITKLGIENEQQQLSLAEKTKQLDKKELEIQNQIQILNQLKDESDKRKKQINEQDKKLSNQLKDISKQQFIIYSIIALFVLALGFGVFMYRIYKQKQIANFKLIKQKERIEKQHQDIITKNKELGNTLTDLKNTQSQLVQSEKMASLGQLTAGVAHEINNPINFVSAGIDSIRQNYDDLKKLLDAYDRLHSNNFSVNNLLEIETLKKDLDYKSLINEMGHLLKSVKNGAMRTTEIIKSLRNFSRLDEYGLKKADIHEGIDSTLTILTNKFKNRIEVVKEYGSIPPINCYPGQLNQVFMNILNNGIDAIEGNGTIRIKTHIINNNVEIRIKDSGKGMSDEVKRKIFEPFFTTKNVGDGTGLGLSISFGIIEKHKGSISVESFKGMGSEFIIQLPINLS